MLTVSLDPAQNAFPQRLSLDGYQAIAPRAADDAGQMALIVAIDDETLARHGRWPWPRSRLAALTRAIEALGPAAIGFDIIMPEPDTLSFDGLAPLHPDLSTELRRSLQTLRSNDSLLAETFSRQPVVLARVALDGPSPAAETSAAAPRLTPVRFDDSESATRLWRLPRLLRNVDVLEQAASGFGLINAGQDSDGVVRRVPVLMQVGEQVMPSLGLELIRVALGRNWLQVASDRAGHLSIDLGELRANVDADGRLPLRWSKSSKARYLSAAALLEDGAPDAALRDRIEGRIVIVAVTALGLLDRHTVPTQNAMPGAEIHVQLIEQLLAGDGLDRPRIAQLLEAGAVLFGGLLLILLGGRLSPLAQAGLLEEAWAHVLAHPVGDKTHDLRRGQQRGRIAFRLGAFDAAAELWRYAQPPRELLTPA
ncbi:MAG: CHASE2 domain-containing protein, partial [Gammaproteobacteria bacterium]|nr:CHASE2 domain-containing protein [Gammaproteobacteria bacterium]